MTRALALHLGVIAALLAANWVLPGYHHTNLARIMVMAVFAMGYNIAFGYTGLLSLGHALFFAAGMYATGMGITLLSIPTLPALALGLLAGAGMASAVGLLALRTGGVSFMIVTLMFAQAGYLTILYLAPVTGGDEGFVIDRAARAIGTVDLSADTARYLFALALFSVALLGHFAITRTAFGRSMIAMRENEERSRMLGYNPYAVKLAALALSGAYAGAAGASFAVLFGYVGASFAGVQYSILPLLYVLVGGAGTVLGPFAGALVMFYLIDLSSLVTTATLFVTGAALLLIVIFAPKGLLGAIRERWAPWLP